MADFEQRYQKLQQQRHEAPLKIWTLGQFMVEEGNRSIPQKSWKRDKTSQLFQFFVTNRNRRSMHKEQIIDRLWDNAGMVDGDRDFKVALHGIHKILEPDRSPRQEPKYIVRQGISYHLNTSLSWIDAQAVEDFVTLGNESYKTNAKMSNLAYRSALDLHNGPYLPNRSYEDWSSEERERMQILILGAILSLAELEIEQQPMETIRLTQQAINIDETWEDAYQLQMKAYLRRGNRPAAIKTFQQCVRLLDREFGLDPLPETQAIYDGIISKSR